MNGWRCPGCGRCYAPYVSECQHCQPRAIPATRTTSPAARSVTELNCECENPKRLQYRGRDGHTHCEQCDGLIAPLSKEPQ